MSAAFTSSTTHARPPRLRHRSRPARRTRPFARSRPMRHLPAAAPSLRAWFFRSSLRRARAFFACPAGARFEFTGGAPFPAGFSRVSRRDRLEARDAPAAFRSACPRERERLALRHRCCSRRGGLFGMAAAAAAAEQRPLRRAPRVSARPASRRAFSQARLPPRRSPPEPRRAPSSWDCGARTPASPGQAQLVEVRRAPAPSRSRRT